MEITEIKSKPLFKIGNFEVKVWHAGLLVAVWFLLKQLKR